MKPEILMSNGKYFNFLEPYKADYGANEIAHALASISRYTGHTSRFYSVAQHSVMVSRVVPPQFALHGLLHDAHESFMNDLATPLKMLLPDYQALENIIQSSVLARFGLYEDLPPEVKEADLILLATERRDLMPAVENDTNWGIIKDVKPLPDVITPMGPNASKFHFLNRFNEVCDAQR